MNAKRCLTLILSLVMLFALTLDAQAKKKTGSKKSESKKSSSSYSSEDPFKGRIGIGFSLGGTSGTGGTGFSGAVGLTYYFIKYLSASASVGYGFAPYTFEYIEEDRDGNQEVKEDTVKVNFVPAEIALRIHPLPLSKISPYFGPGGGVTYTWYELNNEKFEENWYNAFVDAGVTYWVSRNFGLNGGVRYSVPYYDDEWKTDEGQFTFGMSGSFVF